VEKTSGIRSGQVKKTKVINKSKGSKTDREKNEHIREKGRRMKNQNRRGQKHVVTSGTGSVGDPTARF